MWTHYRQRPLFSGMVIETRLGPVGYDERCDLCEMSGRYESIRRYYFEPSYSSQSSV